MGLYIRSMDVRVRLVGKVRFTESMDDETDKMPLALLRRLILEAEGQVEYDLSERYATPLQTVDGQPFAHLPERPTKEYLRTLCELKAVERVLETDFGRGAIKADDFYKNTKERYSDMLNKILDRRSEDEGQNQFRKPPLPGLRLNYFNQAADDGWRGMVMNTSSGNDYASKQVNDPSKSWWNVTSEDLREND